MNFIIIAIDGPSGVGKSTTSHLIAEKLGYFYVDTGAMFRCLAWRWEMLGCPEKKESLLKLGNNTEIILNEDNVVCDGTDVTSLIRTEHISLQASKISIFPSIREVMKKKQRDAVEKVREAKKFKGAVLEGRDIGTVVFPKAQIKFFLEATPEVRARRRMLQINAHGEESNFEKILDTLNNRDYQDQNRKIAPLKPAKDAIIIDTGNLTKKQVMEKMLSYVPK